MTSITTNLTSQIIKDFLVIFNENDSDIVFAMCDIFWEKQFNFAKGYDFGDSFFNDQFRTHEMNNQWYIGIISKIYGCSDVFDEFIFDRFDYNIRNPKTNRTMLSTILANGDSRLFYIAQNLVQVNADLDCYDNREWTALYYAVVNATENEEEMGEMINLLITNGAKLGLLTNDGENVLNIAKRKLLEESIHQTNNLNEDYYNDQFERICFIWKSVVNLIENKLLERRQKAFHWLTNVWKKQQPKKRRNKALKPKAKKTASIV